MQVTPTTTASVPSTTPPTTTTNGRQVPAVKQISGKKLAKQLKAGAIKPDFQNRLAYDLQTGHLAISRLTARQTCQLTP